MKTIPIIDLFAGPGGLGEGFSRYMENKQNVFNIRLSIEKDSYAHKTLELRSFVHQFIYNGEQIPDEYYSFLKQEINREELFDKYPQKSNTAKEKAWCAELGKIDESKVDQKIKDALQGEKNWLLIGGPPCQAYSLVGRSRVGGISEKDHRVYLYKEYLRIIAYHKPAIFVMENVKGLLSAKVEDESMFHKIKSDLKKPDNIFTNSNSPKYRVFSLVKEPIDFTDDGHPVYKYDQDFLIKAEDYGIPQKRHRVILLGIREDVNFSKLDTLTKCNEVNVEDVLNNLPTVRSLISRKRVESYIVENKKRYRYEKVDDSLETWQLYLDSFKKQLNSEIDLNYSFIYKNGATFIPLKSSSKVNKLDDWFSDNKIEGVCNHESRSHLLSDLERYFFAADFMRLKGYSPKLDDYPEILLPDHKNAKSGKFVDRFKVQNPSQPASTITSHISKDGHYFIHYDQKQCRSLTVREAARIQTFPDTYFFCGPRSSEIN